mmetsp:Transcript_25207/g.51457  ORF Transcript_25207/g.51457 Transcript_25207/m.51457 type:complete len:540 (-) Transcript_25207:35-1654(-)
MDGFKSFFTFDPLNLPSSRRLLHLLESSNVDNSDTQQHQSSSKLPVEVRSKLGQTVYWSSQHHYSAEELEPYRQIGDEEMDGLLELCAAEGIPGAGRFDDIVRISAEAAQQLEESNISCREDSMSPARHALADFYMRYSSPPSFVDWSQLQRGIDVFVTYAPAAGTSLYYRSLVGGFSIPKITEVLFATRYLAPPSPPEKVRERLMDTGGFLAACMMSNEDDEKDSQVPAAAIRPGGQGWAAALQVRHLHARVRRSILKTKSLNWNTKEFGVPINQEDMGATLLSFSVNVLVGIEFVAGAALSEQEQLDYLALWRYLGWLLGIETQCTALKKTMHDLPPIDPCSGKKSGSSSGEDPIAHSHAALESIIFHLLNPNDVSKKVAAHLLNIGRNSKKERMQGKVMQLKNNHSSDSTMMNRQHEFAYLYRSFMCRRILGEPLSNELDLPCPAQYTATYGMLFGLSTVHLLLIRVYTLATMNIPSFRRRISRWHSTGMRRFYSVWDQEHNKRMRKSRRNEEGNIEEKMEEKETACPFGMVMQPQ